MTPTIYPSSATSIFSESPELFSGIGTRASRNRVIADLYQALAPPSQIVFTADINPISGSTVAYKCVTSALVDVVSESVEDVLQFGINPKRPGGTVVGPEYYPVWSDGSLLSHTEHYAATFLELRAITEALQQRRGEQAQERFMFDAVMPFIELHGASALEMLDEIVITLPLPDSARYYYAYLLGHMRDTETLAVRIRFLNKYAMSNVDALREGAEEAFGHLSAA
jgi:hypothetical protein